MPNTCGGSLLAPGRAGVDAGGLRAPSPGRALGLGLGDRASSRPALGAVAHRRGRPPRRGRERDGTGAAGAEARTALSDVPALLRAQRCARGHRRACVSPPHRARAERCRARHVRTYPRRRGSPHRRLPDHRLGPHRRRPPRARCVRSASSCATSARVSPWFVPASMRSSRPEVDARRVRLGRARLRCAAATRDTDKETVLTECLDAAGLDAVVAGARSVAIRVSFMLGYDRRAAANVNDPELVDLVAQYLRRHGVSDVAVLEAPTVYGTCFAQPLGRRGRRVLRIRIAELPARRHRPRSARLPVRARVRSAGHQRHVARRRRPHRDAEVADRPDRVRAPQPLDARRAAPDPSTRRSTPDGRSISVRRR